MIEALLTEIRASGTTSPAALASRLKLSPGLVQAMLEDLERMGYLQRVDTCSDDACSGCPFGDVCLPGGDTKLWVLKSTRPGQPVGLDDN